MADNTILSVGTGGDVIASDDIGPGVKYQRIKLIEGADGVNDGDISTTNPLPTETPKRTASGALGVLNAAVTISVLDARGATWEVDTGTLIGTVVFEATDDDTTWFAINALHIDGTIVSAITSFADRGAFSSLGYSQIRLRVSVYTSGTSNARLVAQAGGEVVRLGQAIPAGANNIGDVDVLTLPANASVNLNQYGGTATTLGQKTMAASAPVVLASDQTVIPVSDNAASLTIDNAALSVTGGGVEATALRVTLASDSTGLVSVDDNAGSLTVDQATAANLKSQVQGEAASGAAKAGNPVQVGAVFNTAQPTVTTGQVVEAQATNRGALIVAPGVDTFNVTVNAALPTGANNIGDVDVLTLPALATGANTIGSIASVTTSVTPGTAAANLGKAEDAPHVSGDTGIAILAVENTANTALSGLAGDYTPVGVDAEGSVRNIGNRAHDAVDAGAPVKVGMKAVAHSASPTAVAAADRTDWIANRHGVPFIIAGHPNPFRVTNKYTAAQTDAIQQAVAPGQKAVITAISVYVDKAASVNVSALVEFDDVTDVRIVEHPGIAAGSGFVEGNGGGMLAVGADGQDVLFTCSVPTGGSVVVHVTGYLIES